MTTGPVRDLRWTAIAIAGLLIASGVAALLGGEPGPGAGPPAWRVLLALALCVALAVAGGLALKARLAQKGVAPAGPVSFARLLGLPAGGLAGGASPSSTGASATLPDLHSPSAGPIEVLQAAKVGSQLELCLVAIEGRRYLIGATPHHVTLLKDYPSPGPRTEAAS